MITRQQFRKFEINGTEYIAKKSLFGGPKQYNAKGEWITAWYVRRTDCSEWLLAGLTLADLNRFKKTLMRRTTMTINIPEVLKTPPGPNNWDEVTKDDFAKDYDYIINDQGTITIITYKSEAAKQWCYRFLPDDCPRFGLGFVIEHRYVADIIDGMTDAGLISDIEYDMNMNAEERDRHAGEGQ